MLKYRAKTSEKMKRKISSKIDKSPKTSNFSPTNYSNKKEKRITFVDDKSDTKLNRDLKSP